MKKLLSFIGVFVGLATVGFAQTPLDTITLGWNPSSSPEVNGYSLYFSQSTNQWTHVKKTGLTLQATVGLPTLGRWFFIATASDTNGLESLPSNMFTYEVKAGPQKPDGLRILSSIITRVETIVKSTNIIVIP